MNRRSLKIAAALMMAAAHVSIGNAQEIADAREYNNDLAKFFYASYAVQRTPDREMARHTICNKHPERDLVFSWSEAGFASGPNCPLRINHCAIHERDILTEKHSKASTIGFIQDGSGQHAATAVVPVEDDSPLSFGWYRSTFFGVLGGSPQCPETMANFEIWSRHNPDTNSVTLQFFWNPPRVRVALGIDRDTFSDEHIASLLEGMQKIDPEATEISFDDLVGSQDAEWLNEQFGQKDYLVFQGLDSSEPADRLVMIDFTSESVTPYTAPMLFLDGESVVFAATIATYSPAQ